MARAMQLLLPGSRLRPEFVHAALVEARRRWLGSIEEFQKVVSTRQDVIGDHIFYDPPLVGDATSRWEGALHVRGMPNALEGGHDGGPFRQFHSNLANGSASNTWPCVAQRARAFDKQHAVQDAPRSFFLATDVKGLCRDAKRSLERHDSSLSIVCLDADPVHLTKTKHAPVSLNSDDGLDGHQAVVLDWYLLQRSRWLAPIVRKGIRCHGPGRGATTGGLYDVGQPGQSFFGWALAAAGLGPAPYKQLPCNCGLDRRRVSVFGRPRWTPVPAPVTGAAVAGLAGGSAVGSSLGSVVGSSAVGSSAAGPAVGSAGGSTVGSAVGSGVGSATGSDAPAGDGAIDGAIGQALVQGADAVTDRAVAQALSEGAAAARKVREAGQAAWQQVPVAPAAPPDIDLEAVVKRMAADGFVKRRDGQGSYYSKPGDATQYRSRAEVARRFYLDGE